MAASKAWWTAKQAARPLFLSPSRAGLVPARVLRYELSRELSETFHEWVRATGSTFFLVTLTAYTLALQRYTGSSRVRVSSPMADRHGPGLEDMIGLLANVVVLESDLSDAPAFAELLERLRQSVLDAAEHQDVAWSELFAGRPRGAGDPLFQAHLNLPIAGEASPDLRGWEPAALPAVELPAKYPLTLSAEDDGGVIRLTLAYDPAYFAGGKPLDGLLLAFADALARGVPCTPTAPREGIQDLAVRPRGGARPPS